jgi:hypothetical protein
VLFLVMWYRMGGEGMMDASIFLDMFVLSDVCLPFGLLFSSIWYSGRIYIHTIDILVFKFLSTPFRNNVIHSALIRRNKHHPFYRRQASMPHACVRVTPGRNRQYISRDNV